MSEETNKADKAIAGQGNTSLSKEQNKRLILAASDAWKEQKRVCMCDDSFDVFRRGGVFDVTSKTSFRALVQHEFVEVLNYFRELSGKSSVRKTDIVDFAKGDERRRALWTLEQTYTELADRYGGAGGAANYAAALFRKIHRCGPDTASAKQIWAVIFTMKNRKREAK